MMRFWHPLCTFPVLRCLYIYTHTHHTVCLYICIHLLKRALITKHTPEREAEFMLFVNMCPLTPTDLRRIFEKLDMNDDGFVSLGELNWLLEKIGFQFSPEELESLVGKKSLDFNEFLFFYQSISKQNNGEDKGSEDEIEDVESDLAKAFEVFDLDGDGFITSRELECVLKRLGLWDEKSGKDCTSMICVYDTNLDGQLDFQEFKNMMLLTA